jgi:hypothetical protein
MESIAGTIPTLFDASSKQTLNHNWNSSNPIDTGAISSGMKQPESEGESLVFKYWLKLSK